MEIIQKRKQVVQSHYMRLFERKPILRSNIQALNRSYGFPTENPVLTFPCDADGELLFDKILRKDQHTAAACLLEVFGDFIDKGVVEWNSRYFEPAIGLCDVCLTKIELAGFSNSCPECGATYSESGARTDKDRTFKHGSEGVDHA